MSRPAASKGTNGEGGIKQQFLVINASVMAGGADGHEPQDAAHSLLSCKEPKQPGATLALEQGYTLYSTDTDFGRFPGLKWTDPLAASGSQAATTRRLSAAR